ncbi:MAG: UDP-N-acetylmuramyl-tripeptide synthetase [bacterium]|nr:UDP-N-acetylmuramyl-tripeptide synthetase [bacterium]
MTILKKFYHLIIAIFANVKYEFPSKKLKIIGVTGTKGKTTTVHFIYQILKNSGLKVGMISTTGAVLGNDEIDTGLHVSTPNSLDLQGYLKKASEQGLEWMIIESTSHGLVQHRLWGISFDIGIITNIASDHLDYHKTWKNYMNAKAGLIKKIKAKGTIILNKDDDSYKHLELISKKTGKKIISYGIKNNSADFLATKISQSINGLSFNLKEHEEKKTTEYSLGIMGNFNIYNATASIIASKILKISQDVISKTLKNIIIPCGRMEIIQKEPIMIVVDFAHNSFSLNTSLNDLIKFKQTSSKIISVFGCPGARDKSRRIMGKVSAELADITIITADDPRTEKLEDISEEIASWARKGGAKEVGKKNYNQINNKKGIYLKIPDRKEAISFAIKIAEKGDVVYITGKGHEKSICIGTTEYPWSDQNIIRELTSSK